MIRRFSNLFLFLSFFSILNAQERTTEWWHGKVREVRYKPEGQDFVIENGRLRFNRALYGSNTGFRAEAGDLPEFALYLPGMGGNLKFGLINGNESKWLIDAKNIAARYRPGSMLYEIHDPMLDGGTFFLTVLPLYEGEGLLVKAESKNVPKGVQLFCGFGGASGKKFSRDGDIGADPESSFYLKPEYCTDNIYQLHQNSFTLYFGSKKPLSEEERYEVQHLPQQTKDTSSATLPLKKLTGVFPASAQLKIGDAQQQQNPLAFLNSKESKTPALTAQMPLAGSNALYFFIQNPETTGAVSETVLPALFAKTEAERKKLAERIKVETPDPYINTLGGALSIAADAIWEDPSFLHGAVAWRMRLPAWRGPYAADPLGWHDRARRHFSSYALSQIVTPLTGPVVADTALHLARQLEKIGTSMFSSGYICRNPNGDIRPHHYDMNLVFVDELLNHFCYTGDTAYVRQMWPLLQRHLDWEKRNFDADGDGLYDAYCCIWASDALQYSGGGVTHSSAYNYRANKMAAELARLIAENPEPYQQEAGKILKAINTKLWMPNKGWYAEYKDLLGLQQVHPAAGLWTIYHSLDSGVPDAFQAYQSLKYIDNYIPHIPLRAKGLTDTSLYLLSTTNWQPYTWSVNNVVLAENLHTALAYWQGSRPDAAFQLWKSALLESMYMSSAPGNFEQLSFYDAIRGELYRDFADPIGVAARSLVEGLFGVFPDALQDTLHVHPGFPLQWNHAAIETPDIAFSYKQNGTSDLYQIASHYAKKMKLDFRVKAKRDEVASVLVNGKKVQWMVVNDAVETPMLQIIAEADDNYQIEINWKGNALEKPSVKNIVATGETFTLPFQKATVVDVYDPQQVFAKTQNGKQKLTAMAAANEGNKTVFVKVNQGSFSWWQPVNLTVEKPIEIIADSSENYPSVTLQNNTAASISGKLFINKSNKSFSVPLKIAPNSSSQKIQLPVGYLVAGTNQIQFVSSNKKETAASIINWNVKNNASVKYEEVNLLPYYNDKVTDIFKNQYLSPRPASATLQLPTQGIGNWCYPLVQANIDDAGLRQRAGNKNEIVLQQGIPLATTGSSGNNIAFTSQWNNYPDSINVSLNGKAAHVYLMLAGSTNPMQSQLENGIVVVHYKDGSSDSLELKNPENWWPIEEDYYLDGYAFTTHQSKPIRVYLKSGKDTRDFNEFTTIKGFTNMAVDGGAATVLDMPLNKEKELSYLEVKTLANDVVIGLMSVTLVRYW